VIAASKKHIRPLEMRPLQIVPRRDYKQVIRYTVPMTKDQIKTVLDRVLTWPPERQADIAHVVELMEEQDKSELLLSDEQVAEVKRRLADPNPTFLILEEVRERFARRRT
jgi:hypothetical protein